MVVVRRRTAVANDAYAASLEAHRSERDPNYLLDARSVIVRHRDARHDHLITSELAPRASQVMRYQALKDSVDEFLGIPGPTDHVDSTEPSLSCQIHCWAASQLSTPTKHGEHAGKAGRAEVTPA